MSAPTKPTKTATSVSIETAKRVLRIESEAIADLVTRVDSRFDDAVELLFACQGRIVIAGLGKSGLIGRKIAATFASTGSPALFLHAAEALHGDLGMLIAERCSHRGQRQRRNSGTCRADRVGEVARHKVNRAHRICALHDRHRRRRRTRYLRERRSLLVEPCAYGFDRCRHGHGGRTRRRALRTPRFQGRRLRCSPSTRAASAQNSVASNRSCTRATHFRASHPKLRCRT